MVNKPKTQNLARDYTLLPAQVFTVLIVLIAAFVRVRLLSMPLERDEGEFAYMGQLLLEGIPPYSLAYSMKLPGVYLVYAAAMAVFGQSPTAVHMALLIANLASVVLLFLLGRRLWNAHAGMVSAGAYAVLSLHPLLPGTAAHATQFVVPMMLAGMLLLLRGIDNRRLSTLLLSGVMLGSAFTIKQHAALFPIFGGCYLLYTLVRSRSVPTGHIARMAAGYSLGVILPFALTCAALYWTGVFDRFWFWTFVYARQYVSEVPLSAAPRMLLDVSRTLLDSWLGLWLLAGIGMTALLFDRRLRTRASFTGGLLVFSFLTVCPGFYFREHYLVQMLPVVSLLIGLGIYWMTQGVRMRKLPVLLPIPILLFASAVGYCMLKHRQFHFLDTPLEACLRVYSANPFPQSIQIARHIRVHTDTGDSIAVLGSEPQIYFYAGRRSATGYIYTYGLMEPQPFASTMQNEMISEIEKAKPKYIVFVNVPPSWLPKPDSDLSIISWAEGYCSEHYDLAGVVDILPAETRYIWGRDAEVYEPESVAYLHVLRRKADH